VTSSADRCKSLPYQVGDTEKNIKNHRRKGGVPSSLESTPVRKLVWSHGRKGSVPSAYPSSISRVIFFWGEGAVSEDLKFFHSET
jgi:hypothetical protein